MAVENVFNKNFPGSNVFEISLVRDTDPELPFYKDRYFFFCATIPGARTESGGRTYNKDGRITMKVDAQKLLAMATHLKWVVLRGEKAVGPYKIFSDSSNSQYGDGSKKQFYTSEWTPEGKSRMVGIAMKSGENKPTGYLTAPADAYAIAEVMELMAKKAIEMLMNANQNYVGPSKSNGSSNQNHRKAAPPTPPPSNNGVGDVTSDFEAASMGVMGGPMGDDDIPF